MDGLVFLLQEWHTGGVCPFAITFTELMSVIGYFEQGFCVR